MMKYLYIIAILLGCWFVASAATTDGLLPSGHGIGRIPELVVGVAVIGYSIFRLWGIARRSR